MKSRHLRESVSQSPVLHLLARFMTGEQFDETVETGIESYIERSFVQLGRNMERLA
jgi:hypothetical protein